MRHTNRISAATACLATLAFLGACGGESDPEPVSEQTNGNTATTTGDESGSTADTAGEPSDPDAGGGGSSGGLGIGDREWSRGWIHVEITGDVTRSLDAEGSASTIGGFTNAPMTVGGGAVEADSETVNFTIDEAGVGALALSLADVATTGAIPADCTVETLENTADKVHLYFTCESVDAVSTSSADTYSIGLMGDIGLEA